MDELLTNIFKDSLTGSLVAEALDFFLDVLAFLLGILHLSAHLLWNGPANFLVRGLKNAYQVKQTSTSLDT